MKRDKFIDGETIVMLALVVTVLVACAMNMVEHQRLVKEDKFKACPLCGGKGVQ